MEAIIGPFIAFPMGFQDDRRGRVAGLAEVQPEVKHLALDKERFKTDQGRRIGVRLTKQRRDLIAKGPVNADIAEHLPDRFDKLTKVFLGVPPFPEFDHFFCQQLLSQARALLGGHLDLEPALALRPHPIEKPGSAKPHAPRATLYPRWACAFGVGHAPDPE